MADVTSPFGFPYPEDTDLVRDGASDIENLAEGVNDYLTGGFLYAGTRYYISTGSFVKANPFGTGDIKLRAIRVRLVGGGGGGGGCSTTSASQVSIGNPGSGAAYAERFILASSLSASESVTVGDGGAGGAAGNNNGAAGGQSAFGSLLSANGGAGGTGEAASGATRLVTGLAGSATTSGADLTITGGSTLATLWLGTTYSLAGSQMSGPSFLSGARRGQVTGTGLNGQNGFVRGVGATAGVNAENQGDARSGGNGGRGEVIIDCFV